MTSIEENDNNNAETDKHNIKTEDPEKQNPIYESVDDDVEQLEKLMIHHDTNFNAIDKNTWREVVSPSSSISSIDTDDDDDDFTTYIPSTGQYYRDLENYSYNNRNRTNSCDNSDVDESLNESRVSLQEINMQIGVAEELIVTPNIKFKHGIAKHGTPLETIHEGKFLHTPPKKSENLSPSSGIKQLRKSQLFDDRLARN